MTSIGDLFSREITRDIKEVIKVDDRRSVMQEVEEYVPTDHIAGELTEALEKFQDTINNPSEEINLWISGFFGSGKSSFAKVLGYLLANPKIDGVEVAKRFFQLHEIPKAKALLNTIHASAPTETVLLDLNTSPNVCRRASRSCCRCIARSCTRSATATTSCSPSWSSNEKLFRGVWRRSPQNTKQSSARSGWPSAGTYSPRTGRAESSMS